MLIDQNLFIINNLTGRSDIMGAKASNPKGKTITINNSAARPMSAAQAIETERKGM